MLKFHLQAAFWLLLAWFATTYLLDGVFWQALLAVLLLAAPLALVGLHEAAVEKTLRRERYRREGWFFRLFAGRLLAALAVLLLAIPAAAFLLLRLRMLAPEQWFLLVPLVPLHGAMYALLRERLRNEYKPAYLNAAALMWARLCTPTLLLVLCAPLLWFIPAPDSSLALAGAIAAEQQELRSLSASETLGLLGRLIAVLEGIKTYVLAHFDESGGTWYLLVLALETWVCFYLICTMLGFFLLPKDELRRIFGPLSDAAELPPLPARRMALASALCTFVILFVFVPAASYVEVWVIEHPEVSNSPERLGMRVEQIGAEYYAPGTLAGLQQARQRVLARLDLIADTVRQESDAAFLAMEGNVDAYLDWYYSLGGEYVRLGNLLAGDLEGFMAAKLNEMLMQGNRFREVQAALDEAVRNSAEARELYARIAGTILEQSRVEPGPGEALVLQRMELGDFDLLPRHHDVIGFENRMLASTGGAAVAGVMSSVVAGKLTANIVAKGSFKLAAKSLGKLIAGKAAGASMGVGAGAAAGAAAGSVMPGLGTAIGAVIGGFVGGVAAGIGIDMALIELEESVAREAFRNDLILAIRDAQAEFHQTMLLSTERDTAP